MSATMVATTTTDDEVFAAFVLGEAMRGDTTVSDALEDGHTALRSHGVLLALRSEEVVVFDARPHAEGCWCVNRLVAHQGRVGIHAHEHYEDDEVECMDHLSFVQLACRLGAL